MQVLVLHLLQPSGAGNITSLKGQQLPPGLGGSRGLAGSPSAIIRRHLLMMSPTLPTLAAFPPSPVQASARTLPASSVTMPRHPPHLIMEEEALLQLLPSHPLCPGWSTGRLRSLPWCHHNPESSRKPLPLLHQGRTGHAGLCRRATPDPSELIFIYNVSQDLSAQVRKRGNLLLGTLSHEHTPGDKNMPTPNNR